MKGNQTTMKTVFTNRELHSARHLSLIYSWELSYRHECERLIVMPMYSNNV